MKRGLHDLIASEDQFVPRQRTKEDPDSETRSRHPVPQNPAGCGTIEELHYSDPASADPYERLRRQAERQEEERQSARKDRESAKLQALIQDSTAARNEREGQIIKAWQQLGLLKEYVESLKGLEKVVRSELVERLKYKGKVRESLQNLSKGARQEISSRLGEEAKIHKEEKRKDQEARLLLNEIIKLKQNEDEIDKRIERFKKEREETRLKLQHDETALRKVQEKEEIQKKLASLVQRVSEKNKLFAKEYLGVRVLNEQVRRLLSGGRLIAVLVPKENVPNPFQLQAYLRVSKHHRSLSVLHNEKILEPEKHALTDLEERVGNVEQYAQSVDSNRILLDVLDKGSSRVVPPPPRRPPVKRTVLDFHDIVSLGSSQEEDQDAAEIVQATVDVPDSGANAMEPEVRRLSEPAKNLAILLAPDPIKVFNDALVLKKTTRKAPATNSNSQCRFDTVVTNDYVSTFFDNNVVLKLYSELEITLKSIFYKNFDKILKKLSFYSEEYKRILNADRQKTDFNLHYHTNGEAADVNAQLHLQVHGGAAADARLLTVEDFAVNEAEVQKMKFVSNFLNISSRPNESSGMQDERRREQKSSVRAADPGAPAVRRREEPGRAERPAATHLRRHGHV